MTGVPEPPQKPDDGDEPKTTPSTGDDGHTNSEPETPSGDGQPAAGD